MKRFWMMLLTISVVLVIALPAGVAKPGKGPKPPKAVPIAVSLYVNPMWVHEGADLIKYTVMLQNKTSNDITGVAVKLTTDTGVHLGPVDEWEFPAGAEDGVVPANSSVGLNFDLNVHQFAEAEPCLTESQDECALLATAEVLIDGELLTQVTMSTPLIPYPSCGFEYTNFVSDVVTVSDICIWTLPPNGKLTKTGVWEITLYPVIPEKPKRNFTASVSVRDHVPGNWCSLAVDASWGFGERWPFVGPIVGEVYLPGNENLPTLGLGDGVCLAGGAGGDYFAVGNPDSFYLRTNGDVTVQWLGQNPGDWAWPVSNG